MYVSRYRTIEEVRVGVQVPATGVSPASHPELYPQPFANNPAHAGQHWVHFAGQAGHTWDAQGVNDEEEDEQGQDESVQGSESESESVVSSDGEDRQADVPQQQAMDFRDLVLELLRKGDTDGVSELMRLDVGDEHSSKWWEFIVYDIMHVAAGLLRDTFLGILTGSRWSPAVQGFEESIGRFAQEMAPGSLPPGALDEFLRALNVVANGLRGDALHLRRLLDPSKKAKAHTLFLLAGPIGLYALSCVQRFLSPEVYDALSSLLQAIHLLWCKEQHTESIPTLEAFVYEAVCKVECFLPVSERSIKLHELTQMASSIKSWGERLISIWNCHSGLFVTVRP